MNTSHLPLLLFDGGLRVVAATRSFSTDFDMQHDEIDGRTLDELGDGEWNIPQLHLLLDNALTDGSGMEGHEVDLIRLGTSARRLIVNAQNLVYDDKENTRILLTIHDVTDVRRTELTNTQLMLEKDNLLQERTLLLQEMQHRIANSLQIIASILLLKAHNVTSEDTRGHLQDAHDRVMSVATVQQHLQSNLGTVEVGPYLIKLCDSLSASMIRDSRPLALDVRANQASISSHEAVSLGLIVTELVINSLKYAFPDGRAGLIIVSYHANTTGWKLSVIDNGIGRPGPSPTTKVGLGTSVVEALAQQLGARVFITDAEPGAKIVLEHQAPIAIA